MQLRECKNHGMSSHLLRVNGKFRCKRCNVDAVTRRRRKLKLMAIEYKGGECTKCGYRKCVAALQFHHEDPTMKDFAISTGGYTRSWEKVKIELDKCVLVCANCHAELHEHLDVNSVKT